ncbi:MAG: hypothetical protein LH616_17800 [Ilumatobacteraceae bacterium]|nr:hypothetical protein [Ilumatobacteraceae bacterium]
MSSRSAARFDLALLLLNSLWHGHPVVPVYSHRHGVPFCGSAPTTKGEAAADIVIDDVPADVIAAVDRAARRLGQSCGAYVRRVLVRERDTPSAAVSSADLVRFASTFADLTDDAVMSCAWR